MKKFEEFDREQKKIMESASKNVAEIAEVLLDLAVEYADGIKPEDLRPQLFTDKSEALDLVTAAVTALEGGATGNQFKAKAKELLNL